MMTGFRPFFNPATGEWIEYTDVAEDGDGDLIRFTWRSVPGGVITEHVHPHQEERFIITAGEARFTLDGEERVARAGETIVVPAGVPHSEGPPLWALAKAFGVRPYSDRWDSRIREADRPPPPASANGHGTGKPAKS
jgi:Cupin domain